MNLQSNVIIFLLSISFIVSMTDASATEPVKKYPQNPPTLVYANAITFATVNSFNTGVVCRNGFGQQPNQYHEIN